MDVPTSLLLSKLLILSLNQIYLFKYPSSSIVDVSNQKDMLLVKILLVKRLLEVA